MGIGASVFLIAVGAILTFAVDASISGLDLDVVGVILMLAGLVGILVDLIIFAPRRREHVVTDAPNGVYTERRVVRDY